MSPVIVMSPFSPFVTAPAFAFAMALAPFLLRRVRNGGSSIRMVDMRLGLELGLRLGLGLGPGPGLGLGFGPGLWLGFGPGLGLKLGPGFGPLWWPEMLGVSLFNSLLKHPGLHFHFVRPGKLLCA